MARINLTSDDLMTLSNLMQNWEEDLRSLNQRLCNQIRTMDGWKDPQFYMFLQAIETTSQQLESYIRNLDAMGNSLRIYAEQQRSMNSHFRSQINSIR